MPDYPICLPSGQFAMTRSYIGGLYVRHDPGTLSYADGLLTFIVAGTPDAVVRVWFDERFVAWSSNRITLDYVTTDASYEYPTGGEHRPLPFYVYYRPPDGNFPPCIGIDAMYGSEHSFIPVAVSGAGYWRPPPTPL